MHRVSRLLALTVSLCIVLGAGPARSQSTVTPNCTGTANPELCTLIERGELPSFGRPSFSAYKEQIQDFYAKNHSGLVWLQAGRPTSQAVAMIKVLQNAEMQGLRTEDYDGPAWDGRLDQFTSAIVVSPDDLARFDLALTVSTMQYISDL